MRLKQHKLKVLRSWFDSALARPCGYKLADQDFDSITKGMNQTQIQLMLSLVAATYSRGCDETRAHWSPKYHAMRQQLERATNQSDITYCGLRLVVSNE